MPFQRLFKFFVWPNSRIFFYSTWVKWCYVWWLWKQPHSNLNLTRIQIMGRGGIFLPFIFVEEKCCTFKKKGLIWLPNLISWDLFFWVAIKSNDFSMFITSAFNISTLTLVGVSARKITFLSSLVLDFAYFFCVIPTTQWMRECLV